MSKTSILALVLVSFTFPTLSLAAGPAATQQEADRLKSVFERYVGFPAPGEAGGVTVTPEGGAYRASFDYKRMLRPLEGFQISVEPATQSVLLTPNDNGTWHVASDAMPPLVIHLKDQTIALKTGMSQYEGTYDPKLGVFLDQTMTEDGATLDQQAPTLTQHRRSGHTVLTQKGVPIDSGRANSDLRYTLTDTTARMTTRPPSPPNGMDEVAPDNSPPMDVTYTVPKSSLDIHLERVPTWALLDIWAFLVAHLSREALTASQEELRGLLKAALPLIAGLKEAGTAEGLVVQSPLGEFKAGKMAGSLDVADLSGAGTLASTLLVDGLTVPSQMLPPWSVGLLPSSIDVRPSLTGLHFDEGAQEAVNSFDLKHDGFTPEESRKIGRIVWPGNGKVTLAPSHIVSPLLDLKMQGEATIGEVPAGQLTVVAAGVDKVIDMLATVAPTDPVAAQVMAQFVAAKNLAKPNPDGSLVWVVEASASGPVSVNGIPMK